MAHSRREDVIYQARDAFPIWYWVCEYTVGITLMTALGALCVVVYQSAGPVAGWILIVFTSLIPLRGLICDNLRSMVATHAGLTVKFRPLPVRVHLLWHDVASATIGSPYEDCRGITGLGPLWWHAGLRTWLLDCPLRWLLTARGSWHQRRRGVFIEMSSGRRFWVGSNHPEELLRAAEIGTGRSFTT